jgi:hypothetical protein
MNRFELKLGPAGIAGSGTTGIGAAVLVFIIIFLAWLTVAAPPFVY